MSIEKIGKIFISEIVEALFFVIIILVISSFPDFSGKGSIIVGLISFWALAGIATPFLIWFEMEEIFSQLVKGIR